MRKVRLIALMTALVALLPSCASGGGRAEQKALEMRTGMLEAASISVIADITADYGAKVYEYEIKYTGDSKSGTIEIRKPESIAGLTARVTVDGAVLEYDGASLETGDLTGDGLSPAAALPVLIEEWQAGYITSCTEESYGDVAAVAITTMVSENVGMRTWFDGTTLLPLHAEISENGRMVISCDFDNVTIE